MKRKIYLNLIVISIITMIITSFILNQLFSEIQLGYIEDSLESIAHIYDISNIQEDIQLKNGISIKIYNLEDELTDTKGEIYYKERLGNGKILKISTKEKPQEYILFSSLIIFVAIITFLFVFLHIFSSYLAEELIYPIKKTTLLIEDILDENPIEDIDIYPELKPFINNINSSREKTHYYIRKLKESEKYRREFTANISHELKTPLTTINGFAELLANGMNKEEDTSKIGQIIYDEGNRLLELIEDIIELSNLENPELKIDFKRVDLYQLTLDILKKLKLRIEEMDLTLKVEGYSTYITGNERMLKDLVYNLIDNGIKYNNLGGTLKVRIYDNLDNVFLEVVDTGIGISQKDLSRIFERFYIVDTSRSKSKVGKSTGLGLSIVKHIVEIHKGNIEIKSTLNKGTSIKITLPKE